jgi:hypothetical protein
MCQHNYVGVCLLAVRQNTSTAFRANNVEAQKQKKTYKFLGIIEPRGMFAQRFYGAPPSSVQ